MRSPVLWLYFLGDRATNDVRPTLLIGGGRDGRALALTERARAFVAALAVPPEMTRGAEWKVAELSTWASADVVDRMGYRHRRAIQDAIGDLETLFDEHGLDLDDYVHADRGQGLYGLNHVRVDVVEVLLLKDRDEELDALLDSYIDDPGSIRFSAANERLWSPAVRNEVAAVLRGAEERLRKSSAEGGPDAEAEPTPVEPPEAPAPVAVAGSDTASPEESPHRRPSMLAIGLGVGVAALLATVLAVVLFSGGGSGPAHDQPGGSATPTGATRVEVPGGPAHTWSNYRTAGGTAGPALRARTAIRVRCRVRGLEVDDGNVWWYRITSAPWRDRYYVTADAFYNNGQRSGPLKNTPFFDPAVAPCR